MPKWLDLCQFWCLLLHCAFCCNVHLFSIVLVATYSSNSLYSSQPSYPKSFFTSLDCLHFSAMITCFWSMPMQSSHFLIYGPCVFHHFIFPICADFWYLCVREGCWLHSQWEVYLFCLLVPTFFGLLCDNSDFFGSRINDCVTSSL